MARAAVNLKISSSDVIVDHTCIWRADHGSGVGWTVGKIVVETLALNRPFRRGLRTVVPVHLGEKRATCGLAVATCSELGMIWGYRKLAAYLGNGSICFGD
jgi:hypothetical protein